MTAVFAYGTLELPELMEALTGTAYPFTPAVLEGYVRRLLRDRVYPGIVAAAGEQTHGRLYRGVDRRSLTLLDRFEGHLYERRRVRVKTGDDQLVAAHVYVLQEEHRALLTNRPWERTHFAVEHLEDYVAYCGGPRRGRVG